MASEEHTKRVSGGLAGEDTNERIDDNDQGEKKAVSKDDAFGCDGQDFALPNDKLRLLPNAEDVNN